MGDASKPTPWPSSSRPSTLDFINAMAFHRFGTLALAASLTVGAQEMSSFFDGTSPFYLFSSSE
jgi:hypothetical protein